MSELWFYHLERGAAEDSLPVLLSKTLERGWRALVRLGSEDRLRALDAHLWTWRDESFLPHGAATEAQAEHQPILLTTGPANLNRAQALFLIDDAPFPELETGGEGFERCVLMFNGGDAETVTRAREQWTEAKERGFELSYWQQTPQGRWEKKA